MKRTPNEILLEVAQILRDASITLEPEALESEKPEYPRVDGFWEPKEGEAQYFITLDGLISNRAYLLNFYYFVTAGNSFPSHEAAKMALLRRQSMRIDWVPENGDTYFTLGKYGLVLFLDWEDDSNDHRALSLGRVFRTREEAQDHYETYHKAWEYLVKGGK